MERINNHTHGPTETKCEIAKVRAYIKRRATETQDPAQVINRTWFGDGSPDIFLDIHYSRTN